MLRESLARDRAAFIELCASPEARTFLGGPRPRAEPGYVLLPVVLCTQTADTRSTSLAAKLGFIEVERVEEYGAEQWFGVRPSAAPSG
ncbi:hypothetical protein KPP03845_106953 [Streptomyces xanthophaeus]|nr:hypothetical protein KPP03845_106953 [Streptomyces xanthophaeus]